MDETKDPVESRIQRIGRPAAPRHLRAAVLDQVQRELRAAHWDRRLFQMAVTLLSVGVGAVLGTTQWYAPRMTHHAPSQTSLTEAAISVASASDPEQGTLFARYLALMSGVPLTPVEFAALELKVRHHARPNQE